MTRLNFIKSAIIIASAVFVLSSCEDTKEPQSDIIVENEFADETSGISGVTFVTSGAWTSSITEGTTKSTKAETPSWVRITPDLGDAAGTYTIIISIEPNTTGKDRAATITISCNGMDITITVSQKGVPDDKENDEHGQTSGITYPEKGILGYPNILAEGFVEANRDKISSSGEAINVYSMKAELPKGNSSLKIVIKSAKPASYVCMNRLPTHSALCGTEFSELHEVCPECGGVNTIVRKSGNEWGQFSLHITGNWLGTSWNDNLQGNTFTVYESGKPADAIVLFWNDCIIEYYENGAKEPAKVKEVKVID